MQKYSSDKEFMPYPLIVGVSAFAYLTNNIVNSFQIIASL